MGKTKRFTSVDSNDGSTTSSTNDKVSAFIDHRNLNDLAHTHSSPARTRRRNSNLGFGTNTNGNNTAGTSTKHRSHTLGGNDGNNGPQTRYTNEQLPLTNNNLRNFNSTNESISPKSVDRTVAIDMDRFARTQGEFVSNYEARNPTLSKHDTFNAANHANSNFNAHNANRSYDSIHDYEINDNASFNSLEFGESNPSSEHSSDSTSLDDVCYPEYFDDNDETSNIWPDLKILKEFIDEEVKELNDDYHLFNNFNTQTTFNQDSNDGSEHVNFKYPLENKKVNEVDNLSHSPSSIKITPDPIQPWDKPKLRTTTTYNPILNKRRPDYRFTYFRDDLSKTIHSPNLSGLLLNNTKIKEVNASNLHKKWRDQEEHEDEFDGEVTLEDLFQPLYYSNVDGGSFRLARQPQHQQSQASTGSTGPTGPSGPNGNTGTPVDKTNHNTPSVLSPKGSDTPIRPPESKGDLRDPHDDPSNHLKTLLSKQIPETPRTGTINDSITNERIRPFWLDVLNPTEEEMKVLSKTFGIHPLTTEDIFLGEPREKVELFKGYYFICFTSFDIIYERRKQLKKENERKLNKLQEISDPDNLGFLSRVKTTMFSSPSNVPTYQPHSKTSSSIKSTGRKIREGELSPLSMYMIVFKDAVITFHFSPTPHPINVRRRARILKDYLTVSSDWISYALIDDITDSFAPMIESIEDEVNSIEEAILRMHAGDNDDSDCDDDSDSDDEQSDRYNASSLRNRDNKWDHKTNKSSNIFYKRSRTKSTVDKNGYIFLDESSNNNKRRKSSVMSSSSKSKSSKSSSKILGWKRKGDMLRRIGECRKRVMSVLRLLGSKADVIKGFSKRLNESDLYENNKIINNGIPQSKQEITMYLGDIQDHIITMVQSLNHYEKLLARFHSNYLAQINIDMTKVNNDTNDVLGKITILGTIVLPINVVTGLWGMNVIVPGQFDDGLIWFFSIIFCMILFSIFAYNYAKRAYGL